MNVGPGTPEQPGLNLSAEQMIALLDYEVETAIKTRPQNRGDDAVIPKGLKRIFTSSLASNLAFGFQLDVHVARPSSPSIPMRQQPGTARSYKPQIQRSAIYQKRRPMSEDGKTCQEAGQGDIA